MVKPVSLTQYRCPVRLTNVEERPLHGEITVRCGLQIGTLTLSKVRALMGGNPSAQRSLGDEPLLERTSEGEHDQDAMEAAADELDALLK